MKDYSLNYQEQTNFIKNFHLKKGIIVSNLPQSEKHYAPYSPENEQKVLNIMNKQVENIDKKEKAFKKIKNFHFGRGILLSIITLAFISGYSILGISSLLPYIIPFLTGAGALLSFEKTINTNGILKDIEKTRYFKEHEDELNKNIKKNDNMTLNLPNKMVYIVKRTPSEEKVFDINKIDIDGWTLDQLRIVKENIEREEYFALDYNPVKEKNAQNYKDLKMTPKQRPNWWVKD